MCNRRLCDGAGARVPTPVERLEVEEPQSRQALRHAVGGELAIAGQPTAYALRPVVQLSIRFSCWLKRRRLPVRSDSIAMASATAV